MNKINVKRIYHLGRQSDLTTCLNTGKLINITIHYIKKFDRLNISKSNNAMNNELNIPKIASIV